MIPTWLRSLTKLVNSGVRLSRRYRRRISPRRPSFRPLFEQFEERLVPTTVSIPTIAGPLARGASVLVPVNVDVLDSSDNPIIAPQQGLFGGQLIVWYNP